MTARSVRRRPRLGAWLLAALVFGLLSACAVFSYDPTPLPSTAGGQPGGPQPTTPQPTTPPAQCTDALASYEPNGLVKPGDAPSGSTLRKIADRGRLIAGVSADTYLLGSRNPLTGKIEGFDIDMVKAVAKAIFGDENAYQLKVITAAPADPGVAERRRRHGRPQHDDQLRSLKSRSPSPPVLPLRQKILVRKGSKATSIADLDGQRVCAPKGTSSMDNLIRLAPKAIPVGADNHTGCLALFQQGAVAAITGDDTVRAGLAAQDPYAVVPDQKAFTAEPYGLAFNSKDVDLIRFANSVLAEMKSDGEWKQIYDRWLAEALGPAPAPPKAVYGRAT
jgi:polar amino acid transport system substrate-binding protein